MIISNIDDFSSMSMVRAKVDIYEGTTLAASCTCEDFLEQFKINREGDTSKFFGFGICHKLSVDLIDLKRLLPQISTANHIVISLGDGTLFDKPYPKFYVSEVNRDEKSNSITCTAYDKLYTAASHTLDELNLTAPYTVGDIANACARVLGVPLRLINVESGLFNTSYTEGANFSGTEDLRAILNAIAEVTQSIYYINNNEELVFKRLDRDGEAVHTITKDFYYELNTKTNRTLSTICSTTELGDNLQAPSDIEGVVQYVRNNPLWELHPDRATLINNALTAIGGLTINQFDCDWYGDYRLEIGDKIDFITNDGSTSTSYLLCDLIEYAGTLTEVTQWKYSEPTSDTASNPTNIGEKINQTFARVDKVNKRIELVAGDVSDNSYRLSQIQLDLDSIRLTLEEHQEQIENIGGVDFTEINQKLAQIDVELDRIDLSISETSTKVDEALQEAKDYTDSELNVVITTTNEQIAALELTTNSITASVKEVESSLTTSLDEVNSNYESLSKEVSSKMTAEAVEIAITTTLEAGVDKVTTSQNKYVFDDTGLTIDKSDAATATKLTENGMTVTSKADNKEVLTATSDGVKAKDLHATTYLIIGNNSRLENVNGRTCCYWIGG